MRSNYVDVLAGSSKKAPIAGASNLFDVLPKSQSVPANMFIPSLGTTNKFTVFVDFAVETCYVFAQRWPTLSDCSECKNRCSTNIGRRRSGSRRPGASITGTYWPDVMMSPFMILVLSSSRDLFVNRQHDCDLSTWFFLQYNPAEMSQAAPSSSVLQPPKEEPHDVSASVSLVHDFLSHFGCGFKLQQENEWHVSRQLQKFCFQ